MRYFRRKTPVFDNATPVLNTHKRGAFTGFLIRLALIVLIPLGLIWWFGQPAMLIEYSYRGPYSARWMTECHYASLTGWWRITPIDGHCPILRLLPIDILKFLGVSL